LVGKWSNAYGPSGALIAAAIAGVASILLFNRLRVPKVEDLPSSKAPALRFSLRDQWQLVKHNKVLAVFLVATMFSGFGNMLANPLYQIVQVDVLRMSNMEIGYARAAYFTGLLLTYLIGGRMIDRFDIKYTLLVGIAAYAVVPGLYGFWGSHSSVVIGNFVQGMGEAIWDIGILAFIFRLAPGREASLFGLHLLLFGIRGTIGPLLSSSLSGTVPISAILIAAALCSSVGTVMFWLGNRKREALADGVV
jgi:MFS family permease